MKKNTAPMGRGEIEVENRLIPYVATPSFEMARVLVLAPHPDDEVFGCGGAILRQVAEGGAIQVVVLTDGDYQPDQASALEYGLTRREESRKAAQVLGYGEPVFWGLQDRGLEYGEQLVQRILDQIKVFAPDGVFAPSVHEMHPDHRSLGMAALEAVRRHDSLLKLVMYEVGIPMPRPNVLLDISALAERKQHAMACFVSQLKNQAYDRQIRALNCFRTYTLGHHVAAAEAYFLMHSNELALGTLDLYESEHQRQRDLGLPMVPEDVPLVSVIVSSQGGQSPHIALDSIALQTYSHVEVILLCDDGATADEPSTVCGRFPLRPIQFTSTTGRAASANTGMKSAKGKYLIFLEADGVFLPDHLDKLTTSLTGGDALAACTGVQFVDKQGQPLAVLDEPWNVEQLQRESFLPSNAVLFAQSLVENGCLFKEVFGRLDYRNFWLQIAALTEFQHVPKVSAIYRSTRANLGHLAENQRLQAIVHNTQEQLTKASLLLAASAALTRDLGLQLSQSNASVALQAARANSLESTVQALSSSTSWQVTKPVRFLSRLMRGRH